MATTNPTPIGELLRTWRQRRRLSQLALALEAETSTRHLSFLETGRANPSREMLLRLAERLEVPLRERNAMLIAAGFAPIFGERPLDDPTMAEAKRAIALVLRGHEPFPALALDRHWHVVAANRAVPPLLHGAAPALLRPPVNVLRLSLHPEGLAPQIANYAQWRTYLLERLRHQIALSADEQLSALYAELIALPRPPDGGAHIRGSVEGLVVPLRLRTEAGALTFISTTTVFGSPVDITLSELAIESFFPGDEATAAALRAATD